MKSNSLVKISSGIVSVVVLMFATLVVSIPAHADEPDPPVAAPFAAPTCAGTTDFDPMDNAGYAVTDLTQVFGARLTSYNTGHIVPLYDAFGGSILLESDGTNTGETTYPPLCGTRYVESVGGPVSEWMFCTDRLAQTCGDTDAAGNLVDRDGNPISPMTGLAVNPKLTPEAEKLIAYLVQHGHSYAGVGNQSWGGVTEARSDLGTNERAALQTLVWCISDPPTTANDFETTCENNMDAAEQDRLLALIPETPELVLELAPAGANLDVGETAELTVTTNVFNQPIRLTTGGTAGADWAVCSGDATLTGTTLTVTGTDPSASKAVVLCATATSVGDATIAMSVTPASTEHIGWSQSVGATPTCQVYATFHEVNAADVSANTGLTFLAASPPTVIARTGGADLSPLWMLGLTLAGVGGSVLTAAGIHRRRMRRPRA